VDPRILCPEEETDESLLDRLSELAAILDPIPERPGRSVRAAFLASRADRLGSGSARERPVWSPAGRDVTLRDALELR
jgi:hypothetical protein